MSSMLFKVFKFLSTVRAEEYFLQIHSSISLIGIIETIEFSFCDFCILKLDFTKISNFVNYRMFVVQARCRQTLCGNHGNLLLRFFGRNFVKARIY